jgi:hypothetical protein
MANDGYCGETSMIAAGLYYGQYTSQYTARKIAHPTIPQSNGKSQLLLGSDGSSDDVRAAHAMHLKSVKWMTAHDRTTSGFLAWVNTNVGAGYPTIIGVYENGVLLRAGDSKPDPTYDHIVPVIGSSATQITISDNGLEGHLPTPSHPKLPPFLWTYDTSVFPRTRANATKAKAPNYYSLPIAHGNYGIAISGIVDLDGETLPVRITTDPPWEYPYMRNGSNEAPKAEKIALTITVSNLTAGTDYVLYRYDDFRAVPEKHFNASASKASKSWKIRISSGDSYQLQQTMLSDRTAVYRAVPVSAP